jgi:hypothetical protein
MKSKQIIKQAKKRFKELENKQFEWRSFYNGYLEGQVKQLILHGVVFNGAYPNSKKHQEKLLREIMKGDEELGIYSEVELCECGGNKRVGLDCTMKPCKHPYYKK